MNSRVFFQAAGYAVLFILFTLLFMPVNYPSERLTDQVNGWILEESGGALSVERARIRLPFSVQAEGITLRLDEGSLGMGSASVRPRLLGFLSGKRSASVRIDNPWLRSRLDLRSSGQGWGVEVRSMEIDLSGLPDEIMTIPLELEGKVGVTLKLVSDAGSGGVTTGEARIVSGPVEMSGALLETLAIAPLRLSGVSAVATVKDNVLTLGETTVQGDLSASAKGVVRLSPGDYAASRLELTVDLKPESGTRERLTPLFSLFGARPRPDGSVSIRIRGTVGKPSITM